MEVTGQKNPLRLDLTAAFSPGVSKYREEVYSPMTELSINFHNSCTSHCSTPRRKLSLSLNMASPQTALCTTDSMESGIDADATSPSGIGSSDFSSLSDTPSFFLNRPRGRSSTSSFEISLRKRLAMQSRSSFSDAIDDKSLSHLNEIYQQACPPQEPVFPLAFGEDKDADGEDLLGSSPDSCEVAALTAANVSASMSPSKANRSLSAPPVLDSVEKYFEDLDNDSPTSNDDGFSEFIEVEDNVGGLEEVSSSVAGLISRPLLHRAASCEERSEINGKEKMSEEKTKDKENVPDKVRNVLPCKATNDGTFLKPADVPLKKRSLSFSVKRTEPPRDVSPVIRKRLKLRSKSMIDRDHKLSVPLAYVEPNVSPGRFGRSLSLDSPRNKAVAQLLAGNEENLVGDGSQSHCLPTFTGKNEDLKTINCDTMKKLLEGEYSDMVDDYIIVDCRYPYEYKGGHIKTAVNVFTKEDMIEQFLLTTKVNAGKRLILIFHCEFSSQRGPSMYRFLRNRDRHIHRHCYPRLHYPEMYLLEGGYREFFSKHKELCDPQSYLCMHDENYSQELKHFIKRSKSWTEGNSHLRTGLRY